MISRLRVCRRIPRRIERAGASAQVCRRCRQVIYTQDPAANTKPGSISRSVIQAPAAAARRQRGERRAAKSSAPKTAAEQEQAFRKRQQIRRGREGSDQKSAECSARRELAATQGALAPTTSAGA